MAQASASVRLLARLAPRPSELIHPHVPVLDDAVSTRAGRGMAERLEQGASTERGTRPA
jgi:hypothetical protein